MTRRWKLFRGFAASVQRSGVHGGLWDMPWVRRGGKPYFYQSRRINGKPVKKYFGNGLIAAVVSNSVELRKLERLASQDEARQRAEQEVERVALLNHWIRFATYCMRTELQDAGFHQHARGAWRKRRMNSTTTPETKPVSKPTDAEKDRRKPSQNSPSKPPSSEQESASVETPTPPLTLQDLIHKVKSGDMAAFAQFRSLLKQDPQLAEDLCAQIGRITEGVLLNQLATDDQAMHAVLQTQMQTFRTSLIAEGDGSVVDRIVCEAVSTSWLAWQVSENQHANMLLKAGEVTLFGRSINQRLSRDFDRFLKATKELVTIRKLLRPRISVLDLVNMPGNEKPKKAGFERKTAEPYSLVN